MAFIDTFNSFVAIPTNDNPYPGLKNPVNDFRLQITALTDQVVNPAAAAAITAVTELLTVTEGRVAGMVASIRTQLPLMTAVSSTQQSLGIITALPGSTFEDVFAPLFESSTYFTGIQTLLTPAFINDLNNGVTGAIDSLQALADSSTAALNTSFTDANIAAALGLRTLQADSFAKYVTSNNPIYVQSVLDMVRNWAT